MKNRSKERGIFSPKKEIFMEWFEAAPYGHMMKTNDLASYLDINNSTLRLFFKKLGEEGKVAKVMTHKGRFDYIKLKPRENIKLNRNYLDRLHGKGMVKIQ